MSEKITLDLIIPHIALENESVKAWFTQKNGDKVNMEGAIPGLNIGLNTGEARDRVKANREYLWNVLGVDPEWVAMGKQVHSNRVQFVSSGGLFDNTDGLVTTVPGLTLAIQVADCAAVLLADAGNRVVAALHAGWRGAVGGVVPQGIAVMQHYGGDPQQMQAFISPCIGRKNFEVGPEVADLFPDTFVDYESYEKPHVDLKGFIRMQLEEAGLPEGAVEVHSGCTMEEDREFYSYRREQERSGRMLGMIQLTYKD